MYISLSFNPRLIIVSLFGATVPKLALYIIQNLPNRAARIVTGKYDCNLYSSSTLRKDMNWMSISERSIYYSCVFGKRNYRVLVRVCVCVCVSVFVCVCVGFCTITQKEIDLGTRNRNTL